MEAVSSGGRRDSPTVVVYALVYTIGSTELYAPPFGEADPINARMLRAQKDPDMVANLWVLTLGGVFAALAACWWLIPSRAESRDGLSQLAGRFFFPLAAMVCVIASAGLVPSRLFANDLQLHVVILLSLVSSSVVAIGLAIWRITRYRRTGHM